MSDQKDYLAVVWMWGGEIYSYARDPDPETAARKAATTARLDWSPLFNIPKKGKWKTKINVYDVTGHDDILMNKGYVLSHKSHSFKDLTDTNQTVEVTV